MSNLLYGILIGTNWVCCQHYRKQNKTVRETGSSHLLTYILTGSQIIKKSTLSILNQDKLYMNVDFYIRDVKIMITISFNCENICNFFRCFIKLSGCNFCLAGRKIEHNMKHRERKSGLLFHYPLYATEG